MTAPSPGSLATMAVNTAGMVKGSPVTVQSHSGPIVTLDNGQLCLTGDLLDNHEYCEHDYGWCVA